VSEILIFNRDLVQLSNFDAEIGFSVSFRFKFVALDFGNRFDSHFFKVMRARYSSPRALETSRHFNFNEKKMSELSAGKFSAFARMRALLRLSNRSFRKRRSFGVAQI